MSESLKRKKEEQRLHGIRVSEGIGIGQVLRLHTDTQSFYRIELQSSEVETEVERLRKGLKLAQRQLLEIKARAEKQLGADHAYIFDAHLLMLKDRRLIDEIEGYIRGRHVNAEWAAKVAIDGLLAVYAEIKDNYLRARGSDIEDVGQRITAALAAQPAARDTRGSSASTNDPANHIDYSLIPADAVIVARELSASVMAELDLSRVRAIATDGGGWTAHTAIIARSMGIPAVVGLRDVYARARTGDQIIVDAIKGEAVLNPLSTTTSSYSASAALSISNRKALLVETSSRNQPDLSAKELPAREPLVTKDGVEIILRANVEFPAEFAGVRPSGARGIGLYRSEFLISPRGELPSEEEQYRVYKGIAELASPDCAVIRLFDINNEKVLGRGTNAGENNPALGLRAIRFCLQHEDVMRTQVRAILRAATATAQHAVSASDKSNNAGRLDILLPMVSDLNEVRRVRQVITEEREKLEKVGANVCEVKIGAMIEVPSAMLMVDLLAREVDFLSLGTNDLVQYLLAVDRSNDSVADWFRSLHPAVLRSIDRVTIAARAASVPVIACGEMAGRLHFAAILIGLGVSEMSMNIASLPRIRHMIQSVESAALTRIARACLALGTAEEVEGFVKDSLVKEWPGLFAF